MAQSLLSLHGDLRITIYPRGCTRYYGTAAQLIAEGLIPEGFQWPQRTRRTSFEIGRFTHYMGRCRPDGIKGPMAVWAEGDYWCLQRSLTADAGRGWHHAQLYEKTMELAEVIRRNSPEWNHMFSRAYATLKDTKYQAFRLQLLGEPKRGRGRPTKTTTTQIQGANHV